MNRWSIISVLRSPTASSRNSTPLARYGRLDRSMTTSTVAAPCVATARPMRLHPALSPSASFSTCPTVFQRRKLKMKAKLESSLSNLSFKRLAQGAFNMGFIDSTCTAPL